MSRESAPRTGAFDLKIVPTRGGLVTKVASWMNGTEPENALSNDLDKWTTSKIRWFRMV